MKKPVLTWIALFAIALTSCIDGNQSESQETLVDSVAQEVDSALQVTGVAIDGAWSVIDGVAATLTGWNKFSEVTLFGKEAEFVGKDF